MSIEFLDWLIYTMMLTALMPFIIISIDLNRQPQAFVWLAFSLLFSVLCDVAARILIVLGISPNFSNAIYWQFILILVSLFFYHAINWRGVQFSLKVINFLYLLFAGVNFLFIQTSGVISYTNIFYSLIVLLLSILYFYKLLRELPAQHLQKLPLFWIVSALFFSNAGKLAIYAVTHYLIHFVKDNLIIVWSFHNFLTIIENVIIAYGAWLNHKQLRSTSLSL
jgi:hypothetical protein